MHVLYAVWTSFYKWQKGQVQFLFGGFQMKMADYLYTA